MKTKIEVNGQQVEVDLETMSEEQGNKYNIHLDEMHSKIKKHRKFFKLRAVTTLLSIMGMVLCGQLIEGGWRWSWSIIILVPTVVNILIDFTNKSKRSAFKSLLSILIIAGTIFVGCYFSIWSWCWVFFLLVPIVCIIIGGKDE